jgi:dTDP-glucose 4,6-dehydratase
VTRALVTGGAGFVGSHLCDRLLDAGWRVTCLDSMLIGSQVNLGAVAGREGFSFEQQDVSEGTKVDGELDYLFHLRLRHRRPTI